MKIFIESINCGIWNAIVNDTYIPMFVVNGVHVEKSYDELTDAENKKVQNDCVTKNIITYALNHDEFFKVSQCSSTKEMWEILEVTYEGTTDVKRTRKHALIQEYELFRMQQGKTIVDVHKRFTHIVNHLIGLGKQIDKEELNIKILKCLDRSWQPKVTSISKTRDLTTLTTATLFCKLREHELDMPRLKEMEIVKKKSKILAFKTKACNVESSEENSYECSDTKNLNLLTRRFQKFIKMKGKVMNQQSKRYNKKSDIGYTEFTYFGFGKQGHMKVHCPSLVNKEKAHEKKSNKSGKGRKAYIAWEDNNTSSSSSSHEDVEANLCLMAGKNYEVCSMNSNTSFNSENYSLLLWAFLETY